MASDDDLIEAAPCPNCRSPLTVSSADLGHLVECPGCGTQFRARKTGAETPPPAPPPRFRPRDDDPPPRRRTREDEWDDRDRFGEERPRRSSGRSRFEDDRDQDYEDDRYDDRPRRGSTGAGTALGVINLVMAGLVVLCGCGTIGMSFWLRNLLKNAGPIPNVRPGQIERELNLLLVVGAVYILGSGLYLAAGLTTLKRAGIGRALTGCGIGFGVLVIIFQVVSVIIAANDGDLDDAPPGQICGVVIAILVWIAYIVASAILLAKSGRHFR